MKLVIPSAGLKRGFGNKLLALVVGSVYVMNVANANAAILFQDDTFHEVESDAIIIGSNDGGAVDTAIQFGNDVTPSENGTITWDITDNEFEITNRLNLSGAEGLRLRESSSPNTLAACSTLNEVIINTTSNRLEICTTTGVAGVAVWTAPAPAVPSGNVNPLTCSPGDLFFNTTSSTLQVCTATDTWNTAGPQDFESVYNYDADNTLTTSNGDFTISSGTGDVIIDSNDWNVTATGDLDAASITSNGSLTVQGATNLNGTATIGDGGDTVTINSSDWDISATGDISGAGSITADGLITGTAGADISGAAINFNANSNFATNINTGTSTGAVSIGGGLNSISIDSSTWDISSAGAASGLTTIDASGDITTSGGDFCVGTTCLSETTSPTDSGAFLIGTFDEFDNSNGTNVQDVLDDIDALIGSNAANTEQLTYYPEYPDAVIYRDGGSNNGTLTSNRDDVNNRSFYQWTSNNGATQDIDVRVRIVLPTDFDTVGDFTFEYQTGTITTADNRIDVTFINVTDSNT
ncbi:MAG: hypothetical protein AB7J40_03950, partial [Candidatus Altimarinota bacterium]